MNDDLLATYLHDHYSAATLGLELANRIAHSTRDDPAFGPVVKEVRDEIASEREQLRALIYDLGLTPARYKVVAGWVAEKVSRLKPNGRLGRSSPLTRMIELEALSTGIAGKCRMWRVFEAQIGPAYKGWNFTELAELADSQRERIDALHELAGAWLAETTLARS